MTTILHITTKTDWQTALDDGQYIAPSLESENFIHCSTAAQVATVANKYYQGNNELILLHIDEEKVAPEVKWEAPSDNLIDQLFPHIYGPLNIDAVINIEEFEPNSDGCFSYP